MNSNFAKILFGLILLIHGYVVASELPRDMRPWRVGIVTPSFYPIEVEKAYGINEHDDWTSLLFEFDTYTRSQFEYLRIYDGYAIPLIIPAISDAEQKRPTRTLPDSVYIYWAALVEHKFYVTKFDLTDKMKEEMTSGGRWKGRQPGGSHCYKNLIVFGLLPSGDAKVWLSGCKTFIYIGKVSALKESDTYRRNAYVYEGRGAKAKKFALDNNIQLFPILKDKIDKVIVRDRYEVLK